MQALGARVVGVNQGDAESHAEFARSHALTFPLLSDHDRAIARAFGVTRPLGLPPRRATFVIDRAGVVRGAFHHELSAQKHLDDVRSLLRTLDTGSNA